jgi:hypothetical protein
VTVIFCFPFRFLADSDFLWFVDFTLDVAEPFKSGFVLQHVLCLDDDEEQQWD